MRLAKAKGVYVILSSWGQGDKHKFTDRTSFWQAWELVLDTLKEENLLIHVLYVDFDQEFPYFSPFQARLNELAAVKSEASSDQADAMEQAGQQVGAWNEAQAAFVKDYFESTLAHFHAKYPDMRFTFSLTSFWNEVRALKPEGLDVLELHIWIEEQLDKYTGFNNLQKDRNPANDYKAYMQGIRQALKQEDELKAHMQGQMQTAQNWANELGIPLTTTEAWGPWWHMDHPDLEWDWLYDWCEYCMKLAPAYGFWGVTPWNYSHPYWENWSNVDWYQDVNGYFLKH
jgi:hypothetical protein